MRTDEYEVLEGDAFTLAVPDGTQVILAGGAGPAHEETAAGGAGVRFERLSAGTWWITLRTTTGSVRGGRLVVAPLVDPDELRLQREVDGLSAQLADLERAVEFQTSDTNSGNTRTRSQLTSLRRMRAEAECRLADHRRRATGRGAVGWA